MNKHRLRREGTWGGTAGRRLLATFFALGAAGAIIRRAGGHHPAPTHPKREANVARPTAYLPEGSQHHGTDTAESRADVDGLIDPRQGRRTRVISGLLLATAVLLAFVGYRWTKTVSSPNFPIHCIGYIHGSCHEEESGISLYINHPADPVALVVSYARGGANQTGEQESMRIGANVPAGQSLTWTIELYGVTQLVPEDFGPSGPKPRRRVELAENVTLRSVYEPTPNSGNTIQVLEGTITGPVYGYSTLKATSTVPSSFVVSGEDLIDGDATASVVSQNRKWIVGDLPFIVATPPEKVPGSPADAPGFAAGPLPTPGIWYYPKYSFIDESYTRPIATQLLYSESPPSAVGNTDWQGSGYVHGRFVLESLNAQDHDQEHQFWAGIALGLAGACLLAAVQTLGTFRFRRARLQP